MAATHTRNSPQEDYRNTPLDGAKALQRSILNLLEEQLRRYLGLGRAGRLGEGHRGTRSTRTAEQPYSTRKSLDALLQTALLRYEPQLKPPDRPASEQHLSDSLSGDRSTQNISERCLEGDDQSIQNRRRIKPLTFRRASSGQSQAAPCSHPCA